jgi:hypothetical protein
MNLLFAENKTGGEKTRRQFVASLNNIEMNAA